MGEPQEHRRAGRAKRGSTSHVPEAAASSDVGVGPSAPCGACKFLRRKCISGCIFASHFGSDQGAARFAAVHKVFGASNVSKLLMHIPDNRRHEAVVTIWYEAQARLSDPVYGCVSKIAALQQQVQSLQTELSVVQNQLMNSRFAMANAFQNSHQHIPFMQSSYSNASSASNNFTSINNFTPNFEETTARSNTFEPNSSHLARRPVQDEKEEDDDDESHANYIFH